MNFIQQKTQLLRRPLVMGILNVTPDSFSDGGRFQQLDTALYQVEQMLQDGLDILDIGGESTRPGAAPVALNEELQRVLPVIEAVKQRFDVPISLDTCKADVMREGLAHGVDMINDVTGLSDLASCKVVADASCPVCIMHMQGEPRTMQQAPQYYNVVQQVCDFLQDRAAHCVQQGILASNIILDPGFGFGKSLQHNLQLMQQLECLTQFPFDVLIGVSRKSMIDQALQGRTVAERLPASLALAAVAVLKGAQIIRAHDVRATYDAVSITAMMMNS